MSKIEEKRRKGRIRSQITRKRKKEYLQLLEEKIKKLENENFRLQNLLLNYRKENFEMIDDESKTLVQTIKEHRMDIASGLSE